MRNSNEHTWGISTSAINTAFVRVSDLPTAIQAARRQLAGMEVAEATAIAEALKRANGNKKVAADDLGIARSRCIAKCVRSALISAARIFEPAKGR